MSLIFDISPETCSVNAITLSLTQIDSKFDSKHNFNSISINPFKYTLDLYDEELSLLILHQAEEKKELVFLTSNLNNTLNLFEKNI